MHTEKINEQSEIHLKAVEEEQEQVRELLRRGTIRHYYMGPENIWTQEGFGTVVGGALAVLFGGFVFPKLFLYSSNSRVLDIVCWIMVIAGVLVCCKGAYGMFRESRKESEPVPDNVHDEILEHDLAILKETSKKTLEKHIPALKGSFGSMEQLLVKGPREYSAFVNLPLVWKTGEDGKLRYSNFSVMAFYFGKETLYIYTCIYNMRNGTAKFHHTYECPYDQIRYAGFEDREVETITQNNKSLVQNLKMLVIDAGDSENEKLSMPVADYDVIKKFNGIIDIDDAEEAVRIISERIKGVNYN